MGVQGLLKYVLNNPSTREKIQLRQFAKAHLQKTGKEPEIICDFSSVVKWLLSNYDYALIESEAATPYFLLCGGVLSHYSDRILSFVRILQSLGLSVVFCVDGGPVSKDAMSVMYEPYSAECSRKALESAKVLQICASHLDMTRLQWTWREGVINHVLFVLEAADNVRMMYCDGQVLNMAISYMQSNRHVCGIISSNTSYAIAAGCGLFLQDLFGLDVHCPTACLPALSADQDLGCEVVWSTWLACSLDLSLQQLADLGILCGNEFTHFANDKCQLSLALGISLDVLDVADWLRNQSVALSTTSDMEKFINSNRSYRKVMKLSYDAYLENSQPNSEADLLWDFPSLGEVISGGGFLSPQMVSLVTSGVYWRPSLIEPEILNSPRFSDITIVIRMFIYALMGRSQVTEFGYITAGTTLAQIPVNVACRADVSTLRSKNEQLSLLYHFVTYPHVLDCQDDLEKLMSAAVAETRLANDELLSSPILLFSSMVFMRSSNSRLKPSPNIFVCELEALLVTLLCSLAGLPMPRLSHIPPARAVTLASWFSHLLDQVYWLASCLGLSHDLLPPGSLFSVNQYIPFYMASTLCEDPSFFSNIWSELQQVCTFYQEVWELGPVLELRAEILKESVCPLSRAMEAFHAAMTAVTGSAKLHELVKGLEQVRSSVSMPAHPIESDGSGYLDDSNQSVADMVVSPGTGELSFMQECNATEEDHFFSSQSLGQCGEDMAKESCDQEENNTGAIIFNGEHGSVQGEEELTEDHFLSSDEDDDNERSHSITAVDDTSVSLLPDTAKDITTADMAKSNSNSFKNNPDTVVEAESSPSSVASNTSYVKTSHNRRKANKKTNKKTAQSDLPIMEHQTKILELIRNHTVVCIEGETGCGKSTKVPQFILDEALSQGSAAACCILVTQPRRVAAMKLAERVSVERGERLGTTVGYCVGGDHHRAAKTKLTYCTVGYLLQVCVMMLLNAVYVCV